MKLCVNRICRQKVGAAHKRPAGCMFCKILDFFTFTFTFQLFNFYQKSNVCEEKTINKRQEKKGSAFLSIKVRSKNNSTPVVFKFTMATNDGEVVHPTKDEI